MKPLLLALTLAATVVAAPQPQNQPVRQIPGTSFQGSAIYFRDASGACLRLQLKPMANGELSVLVMRNDACAKREGAGLAAPK
jgi:hypothetical protein